jgi:hypothetical protein
MPSISSFGELQRLAEGCGDGSSSGEPSAAAAREELAAQQQAAALAALPTHAAGEATESLGRSVLPEPLAAMADIIDETHLLQVGAMLGEASARGALAAREAGGPVGHPSSFYGSADSDDAGQPWELLVSAGNAGVLYWGWRRPLRKGLYMYMTRSVFMDASPAELRAFMLDDAYRVVWDNAISVLRPLAAAGAAVPAAAAAAGSAANSAVEAMAAATAARLSSHGGGTAEGAAAGGSAQDQDHAQQQQPLHETAFLQAMVHFPKPMASRSYLYARRVWPRPSDGGCYCLSRGCVVPGHLAAPPLPGRAVAVEDYSAGCVIRSPAPQLLPPGALGAGGGPAAEVFMVYFEDAHRPGQPGHQEGPVAHGAAD